MLAPLSDLLRERKSMTVKQSKITGPFSEITRGRRKMTKYFSQFSEARVLDGLEHSGDFLEQSYATNSRHLLEVQWDSKSLNSGFISLTSSSRSVKSALSFHDGPSGTIPFSTISGMCLFGSGTDWLLTNAGRRISAVALGDSQQAMAKNVSQDEIVIEAGCHSPASYYELEKTLRLSQWIQWLRRNPRFHSNHLVTPRIQYYLYLAPAYDLGRISPTAFLQWIQMVNEREHRLQQLFSEACGSAPNLAPSPLADIEDYIVRQVMAEADLNLDHALEILDQSGSEWPHLFAVSRPQSWKDLVNLSYVAAFSTEAKTAAEQVRHLVHFDDPLESVILSETARLNRAKRALGLPVYPLLGVYLLQKVGHYDPNCDSNLYDYVPCEGDLKLLDRVYGAQGDGLDISKWAAGVHVESRGQESLTPVV